MTVRSPDMRVLVVAKAPVVGQVKTRLAVGVGDAVAADLAAASLLDTMAAVEAVTERGARLVAITGDLSDAARGREITDRLRSWHTVPQRGATFAERLAHAHHDAAEVWGTRALVLQLGMDTPQITENDLVLLAGAAIEGGPAGCGLGPALDGGWWGLSTMSAGFADALADVRMSSPRTGLLTRLALRRAGAQVVTVHQLRDVDTLEDAIEIAREFPQLGFSTTFAARDTEVA